ncbi:MAG: alcohol dehydrogenase catalytic domain-containing protein, partial [Pseudoruegeria sp.]
MFNAILLNRYGGPEELILGQVDDKHPRPGEVLVRNTAINVNFHDIYVRSGLYQTLQPGGVLGLDAAAIIEAIGEGVHGFELGQRVGYVDPNYGAYAEMKLIEAENLIPLPDQLDDKSTAANLLKALTACVLLEHVNKVQAGQTVLIQAAAGGMGQLL